MTERAADPELEIEVDLAHPADRVWRALTEPRLLRQWFAETDLKPRVGAYFQVFGTDLPGLLPDPTAEEPLDGSTVEGEVVGAETAYQLVLVLRGPGLRARLRWELTPADNGGCHLVLHQSWRTGAGDVAAARAAYVTALGKPLEAVLDWLAFGDADLDGVRTGGLTGAAAASSSSAATEVIPRVKAAANRHRLPLFIGVMVLLVGAGVIPLGFLLARPDDAPSAAGPLVPGAPDASRGSAEPSGDPPTVSATATTTSPSASPSRTARPLAPLPTISFPPNPSSGAPGAPPPPDALAAAYTKDADWAFGYRGKIDLTNGGQAASTGWTVVVTLRDPIRVTSAAGATFTQSGETVTFTPTTDATPVAPGATAAFTFEADLRGAILADRDPTACTVNGRACSGL